MTKATPVRNAHAFTLVELLVAASVTVVSIVFLLQTFSATAGLWNAAEQRTDSFKEARAALELMKRDLAGITAAKDLPILSLDYHADTPAADRVNQELYALTATPNDGKSKLCAVGYFCGWNPAVGEGSNAAAGSNDRSNCFVLRRQIRNSDLTFATMSAAAGAPLGMEALFTRAIDDANVTEDLAAYVWDLEFIPYYDGDVREYGTNTRYSEHLPNWIEIRFKAISANAARRLATMPVQRETWLDDTTEIYRNSIAPHQQQFSLRVHLPAFR